MPTVFAFMDRATKSHYIFVTIAPTIKGQFEDMGKSIFMRTGFHGFIFDQLKHVGVVFKIIQSFDVIHGLISLKHTDMLLLKLVCVTH